MTTPRWTVSDGDVMPRVRPIWITFNGETFSSIRSLDDVSLRAMSSSVVQAIVHVKWLLGISLECSTVGYLYAPEQTLHALDNFYKKLCRYAPMLEHECKRRGIKWEE